MSTSEISEAAWQMMELGLDLGLRHAMNRVDFAPFLIVHGDNRGIVEFVPTDNCEDIVESAVNMARQAIADLPAKMPNVIVRDGYVTHPSEGRTEAIIVEFGISGGEETHYVLQRYGRTAILKRFRLIGRRMKLPTLEVRQKSP
jgi:hypothetical protein